ncbi:MAG: M23 family metallopeptidase [Leptospiraceae bacterium]|nr:M23 family metallopeptidase [Leptospiraceae bacterium]
MKFLNKLKFYFEQIKEQISSLQKFLNSHRERLSKKGKAHFTFMIVPHSEDKPISFSISYNKITQIFLIFFCFLFVCTFVVLKSSGDSSELYEVEISDEDFHKQKLKLEQILKKLHENTNIYYEKISNLYIRLGGDPDLVYSKKPSQTRLDYLEAETDIFQETYSLNTDLHNLKLMNQQTREMIKTIKEKSKTIQSTPSLWPTKGYILFPYGKYLSPLTGTEIQNNGVDIGAYPGSEVVATASGIAYEIGFSEITGYYIKISHKYGWKTIYSNLERVQIKKNQLVSRGDIIGYVSKSVNFPVYHLHYEVHVGTSPLNPNSFLNQFLN